VLSAVTAGAGLQGGHELVAGDSAKLSHQAGRGTTLS